LLSTLDDERYCWNGFTREGDLFFAVMLNLDPNRRVVDAAISVLRGDLQYVVRGSRLAPDERKDMRAGPISIEVLEPLRSFRLSIGPNPHEIEGALVFRARTEALEEPRLTLRDGERVVMDSFRVTQFGTWDGWLAVRAKRIKLEASHVLGTHEHSFGLGSVFERVRSDRTAAHRRPAAGGDGVGTPFGAVGEGHAARASRSSNVGPGGGRASPSRTRAAPDLSDARH
jgi:hypothetical protein